MNQVGGRETDLREDYAIYAKGCRQTDCDSENEQL